MLNVLVDEEKHTGMGHMTHEEFNFILQKKEYIKEEEKCGLRREWEKIYKKVCFRL